MSDMSVFDDDVFKPVAGSPGVGHPNGMVMKTLASSMNVSLVLNSESDVWILHDRAFEDLVMWAEYDIDTASLCLILRDGKIQDLGMTIFPPVRRYLRAARQLFTMQLQDNEIADTYVLPLLVRETGYYRA